MTETIPAVNMPATFTIWTDRKACTVISVEQNGRKLVLQEDKATRIDSNGMSEDQAYTYERNPNGEKHTVTLRRKKDGSAVYKAVGIKTNEPGGYAQLGFRRAYHDYSF